MNAKFQELKSRLRDVYDLQMAASLLRWELTGKKSGELERMLE